MSSKLDPRIEKMIKEQRKNTVFVIAACAFLSTSLSAHFFSENSFVVMSVMSLIGSYILANIGIFFLVAHLQHKFYPHDVPGFLADAKNASEYFANQVRALKNKDDSTSNVVTFTVVNKPDTPIGYFQDAPIYDWLDVLSTEDTVYRFEYEAIKEFHLGAPVDLGANRLMIAPGIVYLLKSQVPSATDTAAV